MEVYGVIIAGWASNSKYAFIGAMRATAQMVSYEIAMGFALVGALMAGQSMNLTEIVAGHMVEYSGMSFAMFFLAEYANMILISALASLMFLGGWLSPFAFLDFIPGWIWLAIKVFVVATMFLWVRATFPRFRYDQIMRLGWKIFIPIDRKSVV